MSILQMKKLGLQEMPCFPKVAQLARAEPGFEPRSADAEARVLTHAPRGAGKD